MANDANLDLVRRFCEGWSRMDLADVLACADPEIEFDWTGSRAPDRDVYKGHGGLSRFWAEQMEAFDQFTVEVVEAITIDHERLVAVTKVHGRGRGSGISLDAGGAMLWRVRAGRILGGKLFQNKQDALEAAGLAEGV
jgi:ketosteroid isomerase-like protein